MYGNHPQGTIHKRDIQRKHRASKGAWRLTDGEKYAVTTRRIVVASVTA